MPAGVDDPRKRLGADAVEATLVGAGGRLLVQFLKAEFGPGTKLIGAYSLTGPRDDTVIYTVRQCTAALLSLFQLTSCF